MNSTLLIEILTEELPAIPFLKEFKNLESKFKKELDSRLIKADFKINFTPRRIVIESNNFPKYSLDLVEELYGPPLSIAYIDGDKNKPLSKAGESFLTKSNIELNELKTAIKNDKEVLYVKKQTKGQQTSELLESIILDFLDSLNFGKEMRWGRALDSSETETFIRPIRNILVLLDDKAIKINGYKQESIKATLVHRDKSNSSKLDYREVKNLTQYKELLENNGVILEFDKRKEKIVKEIKELESKHNFKVELDSSLLDEIAAITEYPTALLGSFEERFLSLPSEVIITSMKENQRYFGIYKNENLFNGFIVVANSLTNDFSEIISGNERVLKARLSDAEFFYNNDLKVPLESYDLSHIAFVENLGSLKDKVERESKIGVYLAKKYNLDSSLIEQAIRLSKNDLLSEMVGEFPELQGIMGYYYALAQTKNKDLSIAIKEQYLPIGESSKIPESKFGSIVALAHKLDNLMSLFSVNKIPSGSKDPFALRRAANGVIRILLGNEFSFDLKIDLENLNNLCGFTYKDNLSEFIKERMEAVLDLEPLIFKSAIKSSTNEINLIAKNAKALTLLLTREDKEEIISLFKRVANIIKDTSSNNKINENLFKEQAESKLFNSFNAIKQKNLTNPESILDSLFSLKDDLALFFEKVMVNDKDENLRNNRLALMEAIYSEFKKVGDLKELAI